MDEKFQTIALAIRAYTMNETERENLAQHFAGILESVYPRTFDRVQFLKACHTVSIEHSEGRVGASLLGLTDEADGF